MSNWVWGPDDWLPTVKGHQRFSHKYLVLQIFSENWANRTDAPFHDKWKAKHQKFVASLIVDGNGLLSVFPAMGKSQQLLSYFNYIPSLSSRLNHLTSGLFVKITKHCLAQSNKRYEARYHPLWLRLLSVAYSNSRKATIMVSVCPSPYVPLFSVMNYFQVLKYFHSL